MKSPVLFTAKTEQYPIVLLIASYVLGSFFYTQFPERIASHWSFAGEVDGYSGKFTGAFMLPLMLTGMYALFRILPAIDPKKDRYAEFSGVYHMMRACIMTLLFVIFLLMGLFNLGVPIAMGLVIPFLIGGMMILLGNVMGKIKPNWFMGIRTPWTLASDIVWNKTHRFGGYLFVILGVLLIITPFLSPDLGLPVLIGGVLSTVAGSFVYSYVMYRQEEKKKI